MKRGGKEGITSRAVVIPSRFDRTRQKTRVAKKLRRPLTLAEVALWNHLRRGNLGYSFRKQHPLGPYFLDFYCVALKLAIELDGSQHRDQIAYDERRTAFIESKGIVVIRFWNHEVLQAIDSVGIALGDAMLARRLELGID